MRFPLVATVCWALAFPVFLAANIVVGLAWRDPGFDWTTTNVSDLGNVTCGVWDTTRPRYVCSPWHDLMNVAFVLTAALLVAGLALTWRAWGSGAAVRAGQVLMLLGAAGLGLVGAFPADVDENLHLLGAVAVFGCGNAGLVVVGWAGRATPPGTTALGLLGLAAGVLFLAQRDLGLGPGTMERAAVFPLTLWACWAALTTRLGTSGGNGGPGGRRPR